MPREKHPQYNSGYGQALADVESLIKEARRSLRQPDPMEVVAFAHGDPTEVLQRIESLDCALGWVLALVRGKKKSTLSVPDTSAFPRKGAP